MSPSRRPMPSPTLFLGDGALAFDAQQARAHVCERDARLARLIEAVGPFAMQVKATSSVFDALAEAVVYQQLSGKAAATIHGRFCALFPRAPKGPTPRRVLRAGETRLRSAGLSRTKASSLLDLARHADDGSLPTLAEMGAMDDEAIVERLTQVRGVGRWTAEMFLMFRLGRPDVLPVSDYGIRKGFRVAFRKRDLPSPEDVAKRGARWAPYRTFASWYLWRALDS